MRALTLRVLVGFSLGTTWIGAAAATGFAPEEAPAKQAPEKTQSASDSTKGDTGPTGALSEEDFKALHELPSGAVPPARGVMVQVGGARAYLSVPEHGEPPFPGIVVVHEWWGLNDHIKYWCDRLATDGYAALAVDLYGGKVATNRDSAMAYMRAVQDDAALGILKAAHAFLASDPRVRATRRGCIGWCFGGGWALQEAMATPDLDAAVIYYGRLVTDPERLRVIQAPILGVFGNRDSGITPKMVDDFAAALVKAGVDHKILRYDADHAFANPSNPSYDRRAAVAAWMEVRAFLAGNLKGH